MAERSDALPSGVDADPSARVRSRTGRRRWRGTRGSGAGWRSA